MHEHDGSGCLDCDCLASPINTHPCMCPFGQDSELKSARRNDHIRQLHLVFDRPDASPIRMGEMTVQSKGKTTFIVIEFLDDMVETANNGTFSMHFVPKLAVAVKTAPINDNIILGEN